MAHARGAPGDRFAAKRRLAMTRAPPSVKLNVDLYYSAGLTKAPAILPCARTMRHVVSPCFCLTR